MLETQVRTYCQESWMAAVFAEACHWQKPVVLWCLPHSQEAFLLIDWQGGSRQAPPSVLSGEAAFVVSPFINAPDLGHSFCLKASCWFGSYSAVVDIEEQLEHLSADFYRAVCKRIERLAHASGMASWCWSAPVTDDRSHFESLVDMAVDYICQAKLQKVVLSRRKSYPSAHLPPFFEWFMRLAKQYRHAMLVLLYLPTHGYWLGASPEVLAAQDRYGRFHTMALAGTKPYEPGTPLSEVSWRQKEIEEQALVSRYIINCFKQIRLREFEESGPRTVQAANLIHLRTDFWVDTKAVAFENLFDTMLPLLHPTSAVCGMPREEALHFIKAHEGYDRSLYSGFWGPININDESHLYVNLRCLQYDGQYLHLYAGCGITADSQPHREWQETEHKMQTLLTALI